MDTCPCPGSVQRQKAGLHAGTWEDLQQLTRGNGHIFLHLGLAESARRRW